MILVSFCYCDCLSTFTLLQLFIANHRAWFLLSLLLFVGVLHFHSGLPFCSCFSSVQLGPNLIDFIIFLLKLFLNH